MHKAPQMLRVGPIHSWHSQVSPSAFGPVLEKYQLVRPQNSVRGAQAHGGGRSQSRWLSKKAHIEKLVPLVVAAMAAMVVELAQSKQSIALVVLGLNLSESCFRALQSPSSSLFTCKVCPAQLRQHRQLTVRVYIYIRIHIYIHTTPHRTIPYHYLSLHYIPLHYIHCITYHLHCITLHYIPYHYITLYTFIQQYRHTRPDHTKPYISLFLHLHMHLYYIHMFYMYITLHYTHCITYTAYITCITYVIYIHYIQYHTIYYIHNKYYTHYIQYRHYIHYIHYIHAIHMI